MASTRILRFRITEADYQRLREAALADRLAISTLIRFAVADWLDLDGEPCPSCSSFRPRPADPPPWCPTPAPPRS